MGTADEVLATVRRITTACEELGVSWAVGGSFASAVYGEPRATNDIDVIACLRLPDISKFVHALGEDVYVDSDVIRDAILNSRSFNIIDESTFVKIDVFIPPPGPLGEGQLQRRRKLAVADDLETWVLGPEDILLQKIRWFRLGGESSDRQWRDICAIIRISEKDLDFDYLQTTATAARIDDLLRRARAES